MADMDEGEFEENERKVNSIYGVEEDDEDEDFEDLFPGMGMSMEEKKRDRNSSDVHSLTETTLVGLRFDVNRKEDWDNDFDFDIPGHFIFYFTFFFLKYF